MVLTLNRVYEKIAQPPNPSWLVMLKLLYIAVQCVTVGMCLFQATWMMSADCCTASHCIIKVLIARNPFPLTWKPG